MTDQIDFYVAVRDAAQSVADAADKYLQTTNPEWDPKEIEWRQTEGPKGIYERANKQSNHAYQMLVKDLQAHDGRLTRNNFFYWLFKEGDAVGRKPRTS